MPLGTKFEQIINLEDIRRWLESNDSPVEIIQLFNDPQVRFRIEAREDGNQRDPRVIGLKAVWWTPVVATSNDQIGQQWPTTDTKQSG